MNLKSIRYVLFRSLAPACALGVCMQAQSQIAPYLAQVARYTGLHAAAARGDVAEIEMAISQKADPNARDDYGRSPLHVATFFKHSAAIRALAKADAQLGALENDRYDAVTIASVADDEESLRTLLALGASARLVTSRYDGTALIAAAHLGHDGVVRQLLAAGAPIDHVNNLHWTAAIEAVVLGDGGARHQATLKALIDAKANLALTDRQGNTPLALAKSRGYQNMIRMLEAAGAK
jgi:uncharacterized protein